MAFRIAESVIRGEIDNRTKGTVTGTVWLLGRKEPLRLHLRGNAHPDLAGCLLVFENPRPGPADPRLDSELHGDQTGTIGDLTASRKCRVYDVPLEEVFAMHDRGEKPPEHLANVLYLEWFSERNGRVVIEGPEWKLTLGAPEWTPTAADEEERARLAAEGLAGFMQRLTDAVQRAKDKVPDPEQEWDEHDYEKFFKANDARNDKYMELLDKFGHSEEAHKKIAREMGWKWLEEAPNAREAAAEEEEDGGAEAAAAQEWGMPDDYEPPEPDPHTEGIDWIRRDDGEIVHPLAHRAFENSCRIGRAEGRRTRKELMDFSAALHMVSAKLAGALNSLWEDKGNVDAAFTVAYLKRALNHLHEAQAAFQPVRDRALLPADEQAFWESELAAVREEILRLMDRYRGQGGP